MNFLRFWWKHSLGELTILFLLVMGFIGFLRFVWHPVVYPFIYAKAGENHIVAAGIVVVGIGVLAAIITYIESVVEAYKKHKRGY